MRKRVKITIGVLAIVIFIILAEGCSSEGIHFTKMGLKTKYVSRVETIEDYYVAIYEDCYVGEIDTNGDYRVSIISVENPQGSNILWYHKELFVPVVYKRFLWFSKEQSASDYRYMLKSEDGTLCYGAVYVLPTSSGKYHYYYVRFYTILGIGAIPLSPENLEENIQFSYDGKKIELENYTHFSSDVDFTRPENDFYFFDNKVIFEKTN